MAQAKGKTPTIAPAPIVALVKQSTTWATALQRRIVTIVLKTNAEYEALTQTHIEVRQRLKELTAKEKAVTGPINQGLKAFREMLKPLKDTLMALDAACDQKCFAFRQALDAAKVAAVAQTEKQVTKLETQAARLESQGKIAEATAARVQAETIVSQIEQKFTAPAVEGMHVRKTWTFRVTNLDAVPREYLILDEVRIGKIAREKHNTEPIEGIEFYEEEGSALSKSA